MDSTRTSLFIVLFFAKEIFLTHDSEQFWTNVPRTVPKIIFPCTPQHIVTVIYDTLF
jgi:hypothetical protein